MSQDEQARIASTLIEARNGAALPDDLIEALLPDQWHRLFPLRMVHGEQIRAVIGRRDAGVAARAAFRLAPPEDAQPSLYRDFYVDIPPDADSLERAIGELRRGDIQTFARMFSRVATGLLDWQRIWYHVCILTGRVVGPLRIAQGEQVFYSLLEPEPVPDDDGIWRSVADARGMGKAMSMALNEPLGLEGHRMSAFETFTALRSGQLKPAIADGAAVILRHHTDLAVAVADGRPNVGRGTSAAEEAAKLAPLEAILGSFKPFALHLWAGLISPSRARRYLCHTLLRIDGSVSADAHPDDRAPFF